MHFAGVFLLICLSIGTVSSLSLGGLQWPPSSSGNPSDLINLMVGKGCAYFAQNPNATADVIKALAQYLGGTNPTAQIFTQTIAYLKDPANQAKLVDGANTCPTFFNELYKALVADWTSQTNNPAIAKANALNTLTILNNILMNYIK